MTNHTEEYARVHIHSMPVDLHECVAFCRLILSETGPMAVQHIRYYADNKRVLLQDVQRIIGRSRIRLVETVSRSRGEAFSVYYYPSEKEADRDITGIRFTPSALNIVRLDSGLLTLRRNTTVHQTLKQATRILERTRQRASLL